MTATMTNTSTSATSDVVARIRELEAAVLRIEDRRALPGDSLLVTSAGLTKGTRDWQDLVSRLAGVKFLSAKSGSAKEYNKAKAVFEETQPRVDREVSEIDSELVPLESKVQQLKSSKSKLLSELKTAETILCGMDEARERLRAPAQLPKPIVDEYSAQLAAEWTPDLRAKRRDLSDRMHSAKSAGNSTQAESFQKQLEALESQVKSKVATACDELLNFYVDAIE